MSIKAGKWDNSESKPYLTVNDELSVTKERLVLRSTRICTPESLQGRAVELTHQGHQGVMKTKALIREKVWFSGNDKMVEERVKNCLPCQATSTKTASEPLQMTNITNPGEEVSIDFADVGNRQYKMVMIDDFTRYPEVEVLSLLTAKALIQKLRKSLPGGGHLN